MIPSIYTNGTPLYATAGIARAGATVTDSIQIAVLSYIPLVVWNSLTEDQRTRACEPIQAALDRSSELLGTELETAQQARAALQVEHDNFLNSLAAILGCKSTAEAVLVAATHIAPVLGPQINPERLQPTTNEAVERFTV